MLPERASLVRSVGGGGGGVVVVVVVCFDVSCRVLS